MQLTTLEGIFPHSSATLLQNYIDGLSKVFDQYTITSNQRQACFLGQVGVESDYFTCVEENLHYSYAELIRVFPSHFDAATAQAYANQPEAIANRVYANRMGNGPETSGDGWNYRGRGLIQITGKDNYQAFADSLGMTLDQVTTYLSTPEGACMSAGWFWGSHNLNPLADNFEVTNITKAINGGTNGIAERIAISNQALRALNAQ
jgi:putative chitinase